VLEATKYRTSSSLHSRPLSTDKPQQQSSSSVVVLPPPQPVVVLRDDILFPKSVTTYGDILTSMSSSNDDDVDSDFDDNNINRLRFVSRPILGGDLNTVTHAMFYQGGLKEWQKQEKLMNSNNTAIPITTWSSVADQWQHDELLSCIQSQQSSVYVEAPFIKSKDFNDDRIQIPGLSDLTVLQSLTSSGDSEIGESNTTIFEIRKYNLQLGYDTVPKFLKLYADGLPSKLDAPGTDDSTTLLTLLYSEIGRLNEVIEIWRHGNGLDGMERSRVAARSAQEWRSAIAQIADLAIEFRSTVHKPLPGYSPLQ
jgi:hypothetical protein